MIVNRFTVIIDACVLHCVLKRNIILSLASSGLFRPRWTRRILDEFENSLAHRFQDTQSAQKQRMRIETAFEEACIDIDPNLEASFKLPDPNDLHVLHAAIHVRAALIVTENLKDFPDEILQGFETEAISADHSIADAITLSEIDAMQAIKAMRARFKNPAVTSEMLIQRCEAAGLPETANLLSNYRGLI